jgi:hydrocephalus-inducing protein
VPSEGTVPKFGSQTITVEFVPIAIKDYSLQLLLITPNGDDEDLRIPIKGTCICPEISLLQQEVDMGELFIGHACETFLGLVDETDYPAKFEMIEQTDSSTLEAKIDDIKPRGIAAAHRTTAVPLSVTPLQLGHLRLVRHVRIYGSDQPPLAFVINALATGPKVRLSTQQINFGQIDVLQDSVKSILIENDSLIKAHFKADFTTNYDVFKVTPAEGDIEPRQSLNLDITANLNDVIAFSSILNFAIIHLSLIKIDIKAKGKGTTIQSNMGMELIDFGYVFTGQNAVKRFEFLNRGRRPHEISWQLSKTRTEGDGSVICKIEPPTVVLQHGDCVEFSLSIQSSRPTSFTILPVCHCVLDRQRSELFKPTIQGVFIHPVLELKDPKLVFTYVHDLEREEQLSSVVPNNSAVGPSKELLQKLSVESSLRNTSALPVFIDTICPNHFQIIPNQFPLEPQEEINFEVIFDPSYKTAFASEIINDKIWFVFKDSPQKCFVQVSANLIFPNLSFSPETSINVGTLLLHTEETHHLTVTNVSQVRADFVWELLSVDGITRIFDISPIRGSIGPGENEEIHITFCATQSAKITAIAICHIVGGPDYKITLTGSAAFVEYDLTPRSIDFGRCDYLATLSSELVLLNKSDVPVTYQVRVPKACGFRNLVVTPKTGTAASGETVQFSLRCVPGVPKLLKSLFFVQIGHFDDVQIDLAAHAFAPQLAIHLPRHPQDPTTAFVHQKSPLPDKKIDFLCAELEFMVDHLLQARKVGSAFSPTNRNTTKLDGLKRFSGFVISRFLVDLGTIILGEKRSIDYKIQSRTPFPLSFEIITTSLKDTGFSLGPSSFRDVPPDEFLNLQVLFESTPHPVLGDVEYEVPIIFREGVGYVIHVKAKLTMPELIFSKMYFDFGSTILGQTRIQALQLQNNSLVPCAFRMDKAAPTNVLQRGLSSNYDRIFTATPSSGILPPSSCQNIEIAFCPRSERSYLMQLPITIKHNSESFAVSLKGNGVHIGLIFDPPQISFPPFLSFSDSSRTIIQMINPNNYAIDVFSYQFDSALHSQEVQIENSDVPPSIVNPGRLPYLFALCVIVHGPMKSGRSTISQVVSDYFGKLPVICLREVWFSPTGDAVDFPARLQTIIKKPNYQNGFVIDGLDAFSEGPDSEAFLVHFLKQKGTADELQKNPFTVLHSAHKTACETALNHVLTALCGQYVFQIALNAAENVLQQRKAQTEQEEREKRSTDHRKEMDSLFNMTEAEYSELSVEERNEIDVKRETFRKYLIAHNGDLSEFELDTSKRQALTMRDKFRKTTRGRAAVPSDPLLLSVMLFQYTFDRICSQLCQKAGHFEFLDLGSFGDQDTSIGQCNSLLIDATIPVQAISSTISKAFPVFAVLKEKAFKALIPPETLILPRDAGLPQLQPRPAYFRIAMEPPATTNE